MAKLLILILLFFDLKIKAIYLDYEDSIETRIYIESIYQVVEGGENKKVGIQVMNKNDIKLYPNLANEYLKIKSDLLIEKILLYNSKAQVLKSYKINDTKTKIEVKYLKNGIYILKVFINNQVLIKRIIVNR